MISNPIWSLLLLTATILATLIIAEGGYATYTQPEQIHISYTGEDGDDGSGMYITWVTLNETVGSLVEYGQGKMDQVADGYQTKFIDGGGEKRFMFIHRVKLDKLHPGETYIYHVGSMDGWSSIYYFTAMKSGQNWSPTFAVFGDMGNNNARTLSRLQQFSQRGMFDVILHDGDMAYNMASDNARVGDQWIRQIEPMAAYVPYMTSCGNHEWAYNFSNYVNRFTMPSYKQYSSHFFSFDVGPVHVISFNTDFYFHVEYGWLQIANQYVWLENDLKKANANRKRVPWIITMAHRPMYCSNANNFDCTKYESIVRGGLPGIHAYALEPLFFKYGVDLEIWAHEHSYERMYPLYNRTVSHVSSQQRTFELYHTQVYNKTAKPYVNPVAPVHVVTGAAGSPEGECIFSPYTPPWTAFRTLDYGFSIMKVHNLTHLQWQQLSENQNGKIIDEFWIVKNKHEPYDEEAIRNVEGTYIPLEYDHQVEDEETAKKLMKANGC